MLHYSVNSYNNKAVVISNPIGEAFEAAKAAKDAASVGAGAAGEGAAAGGDGAAAAGGDEEPKDV